MGNSNKQSNPIVLIPIAMMFLVIGTIAFESTIWLKFAFLILSVILSAMSLLLLLKNEKNKNRK